MLRFRNLLAALMVLAGALEAQPALSTVQDILYRADGTRFTGTLYITWNSFQSGDSSNIATSNITLQIVNGVLKVQLVPTTTASAGAQYSVRYNSRGINQFTELWAVPPSSTVLKIRDVRVASGSIVGPPPVTSPVNISDVTDLQNELAVRPMKGVGFGVGRVAVINQAGQVDAAAGSLGDCVHVDGSAGPCGSGGSSGSGATFSDSEVPSGTVNGSNVTFALANAPSPAASLELYRNGLLLRQGSDYQISSNTITFFVSAVPQSGDLLLAYYRYQPSAGGLTAPSSPEVVCSAAGTSSATSGLQQLGSCTIPAGTLQAGDRLEIRYQYGHSGSTGGVTVAVQVGNATILSRTSGAADSVIVGHSDLGFFTGGQTWESQSWGSTLALQSLAGQANESMNQSLTVRFLGQAIAPGPDAVSLRNFTVVRYPSQVNP